MQTFSPFRSTATFKPKSDCPDIFLYYCPECGHSFQALGWDNDTVPSCCGTGMKLLDPVLEDEAPDGYGMDYTIEGGLNYDAVKITWTCPEGVSPAWIMLKTYTGSYIRYLTPKKRAPMTFALADEDAYVYCDKQVCERCTFRCKLGFAAFMFFTGPSPLLLEITLDKVAPRFKTQI